MRNTQVNLRFDPETLKMLDELARWTEMDRGAIVRTQVRAAYRRERARRLREALGVDALQVSAASASAAALGAKNQAPRRRRAKMTPS